MPEDLYGAERSTVTSTSDTADIARSFVRTDHRDTPMRDRDVNRRQPLSAADFIAEYRDACAQTDRLFAAVLPDYLTSRPVAERHRLLFYIGHLEAFDWNLLAARALGETSFHPAFDHLFAFGIDPVGGGLPTDVPEDWPTLDAIRLYRDTVRDRIENAIARVDFADPVTRVPQDDWTDVDRSSVTGAEGLARAIDPDKRPAANNGVSIGTLCLVALEHRQMHAETLAYLIHQMPYAHKRAPVETLFDAPKDAPSDAVEHVADTGPMCAIPAGPVIIGLAGSFTMAGNGGEKVDGRVHRAPSADRFGWDNEWVDPAAAAVTVPAFEIDKWMVTNGAFLRFVEAGGYDDPSWWHPEDWAWRQTAGVTHPAFWERDATAPKGWRWRGMFAPFALPLDWPVYVSRAEAAAYARFVGKRLPTEAEWLRAAEGVPGLPDAALHSDVGQSSESLVAQSPVAMPANTTLPAAVAGDSAPCEAVNRTGAHFSGNADFRRWDPDAVDRYPENRSRFGVTGQFGNGWEWTADPFAPFEGFKAFPFYRGYSADFFDAQHFVMKGGSPRTAARMLRPSFRNWFQAHYPYVYAGFRCAR